MLSSMPLLSVKLIYFRITAKRKVKIRIFGGQTNFARNSQISKGLQSGKASEVFDWTCRRIQCLYSG